MHREHTLRRVLLRGPRPCNFRRGRTLKNLLAVRAPFISVALLARFGYASVALYMIAMAVVTVIAVYLATETFRRDLYRDEVEGAAAIGAGATITS